MKKFVHTVTIQFETQRSNPKGVGDVVESMFVQLEGLTDDYGVKYENPTLDHQTDQVPDATTQRMVEHIAQRLVNDLISEELANDLAHEMTKLKEFKNRPDLHDEFMSACGIIEEKVRRALGVKRG